MGEDGPEYDTDFREQPAEYRVGRGEQGVFKVEPYKSELLPLWGIKSLDEAEEAARRLYEKFREYGEAGEFAGQDMARKYLQMGFVTVLELGIIQQ